MTRSIWDWVLYSSLLLAAVGVALLVLAGSAEAQLTQAEERENWQLALADLWWLLLLVGFLITRLFKPVIFRPIGVLALDGLLTLPLDGNVRLLIMGATSVLFVVDLILILILATNPKTRSKIFYA